MSTAPLRCMLAMLVLGSATLACGGGDDDDDDFDHYQASLTGAAEVPPRQTNATGSFLLMDRGATMEFELTVIGGANITAAHIHTGNSTVAGPILVDLYTGPTLASVNGVLASGSFSASSIRVLSGATAAISMDSLRTLMRTGNAYVNVHSTTYPAGEIRGTITRQ